MNHFAGLVVLSIAVSLAFTLLDPHGEDKPVRYFFKLLGYMVGGSLAFSWLMYFLPF